MERINESKTITQIDKSKYNGWALTYTISRKIDNTVKSVTVVGYIAGGDLNITKDVVTGAVNQYYNSPVYDATLIPEIMSEIEVIETEDI